MLNLNVTLKEPTEMDSGGSLEKKRKNRKRFSRKKKQFVGVISCEKINDISLCVNDSRKKVYVKIITWQEEITKQVERTKIIRMETGKAKRNKCKGTRLLETTRKFFASEVLIIKSAPETGETFRRKRRGGHKYIV